MDFITHYEKGAIIRVSAHDDAPGKRILERARRGYYRSVDAYFPHSGIGVDMRGKTNHPVHSYVLDGRAHFVDAHGFSVLSQFLAKRRLTVLAKRLIETGKYEELAREYGFDRAAFGNSKSPDADLAAAMAMMA